VFLLEDLVAVTLWLLATVIVINVLFLAFVFYRRWSRNRYYRAKDEARERYRRAVTELVWKDVPVEQAAELLRGAKSVAEREAVQELLLAGPGTPGTVGSGGAKTPSGAGPKVQSGVSSRVGSGIRSRSGSSAMHLSVYLKTQERVSELFFALGYVDEWAREAFGRKQAADLVSRSRRKEKVPITTAVRRGAWERVRCMQLLSVPRALAVDRLGSLSADYAQVFVAEALQDPATDVRSVAIAAMGRNRHPAAIPLLLEELRKAVDEGNDVSLRATKAALCSYQLADAHHFTPFLKHRNQRMRFFVVDSLREICNREAKSAQLTRRGFPEDLCDLLLQNAVNDPFPDVRARSAALVAHFRDAQAVAALRALLRDENEFVRLHAVRVCADRYYGDLIPDVLRCLSDQKWRVREAAVQTLAAFGVAGLNEMFRYFAATTDRYESEQIAEEIQRTGLVDQVLTSLASGGEAARLADAVCRKMALMGKNSLLTTAVAARIPPEARLLLMEALLVAPTPRLMSILETLAETDGGPVGQKAKDLLRLAISRSASISASRG